MDHNSDLAAAHRFILQTYTYYTCLMAAKPFRSGSGALDHLGGHLFWAGELDETGRALTVAGNVAGAATLVATSDTDQQKQAVREGIVDFLVNSLDEALRILKNEVRKRETVAVCVAAALDALDRERTERGVQPDLLREDVVRAAERSGATEKAIEEMRTRVLVVWRVERAPALWLPKLDALALECLEPEDAVARRWLLRSSRYLGRIGQAEHMVWTTRESGARMIDRVRVLVTRDEIKVPGRIEVQSSGVGTDLLLFGGQNATDQA